VAKKISLVVIFLLALSLGGYFWLGIWPPPRGEVKTFVVNQGESVVSIASRLESQGLIRNRFSFLALLALKGVSGQIQAGSFRLRKGSSMIEVINQLQQGRVDVWVTLIEGLRKEEMAIKLARETTASLDELLALMENKEGYFFPDTYLLPKKASAKYLVSILLNNFEKKWQTVRDEMGEESLTKEEVVILAALIEREAKLSQDRPIVAGILVKRWQAGWPLQVDATVQYAKANRDCFSDKGVINDCNWWPKIKKGDLKIKSEYNTYLYKGLPPGPICNPSLSAIRAVIDYQDTDYWFYLSDLSGKMHFAKTNEEHQANIDRYLSP